MELNKEAAATFAIQSYDKTSVTINGHKYASSLIVNKNAINSTWEITDITTLDTHQLEDLLQYSPEIIIFGHNNNSALLPMSVRAHLAQLGVGSECMSLGAACRTFNILLGEGRNVVFAVILNN